MSRLSLIALAALPVTILLFIITYGLWVESATGNANYIYFQCLAFNLLYSVIVLDFIGATVRRDKALRVTKKARLKLEK
jgi:phosphatidylinositol glycan class U